jgi:hypothetical protein
MEHLDDFNIRGFGVDGQDSLLLLRTQVGFNYRFSENAHIYLQLQDSRHWLSDLKREDFPETCPYFDQLDVRQAYLEWQHIGGSPVGLKIGRQSFRFGDGRVFGPGDWGNVGRYWWDAMKLTFDWDAARLDLLYGRRVTREQIHCDDEHFDFDMWGVYTSLKRLPCTLDLFYTFRRDDGEIIGEDGPGHQRTHTVGAYVDGKFGSYWDYRGTGAVQFGRFGQDRIEAYGANMRIGYTFDVPWQPRIGFEFSYASGDRDPSDGRHETFDGVFGGLSSFYGRMNFFSWMNLLDYQATFRVRPTDALSVSLDYHYFLLASDRDAWYWCTGKPLARDARGRSGSELGHEIDLLARWTIRKDLELFLGYAHFFPGNFVGIASTDADDADWAFVQLLYRF